MNYLSISWGAEVKMYTLRHIFTKSVMAGSVAYNKIHNEYCVNLAITAERAVDKATTIAFERGLKVDISAVDMPLEEIKRRDRELLNLNNKARAEAQAIILKKAQVAQAAIIAEGLFFKGKYTGKTPAEVVAIDPGYIEWASKNMDSVHKAIITKANVLTKYSQGFLGEEGEAIEVTLKLISFFWTSGRFPTLMFKCLKTEDDGSASRVHFFSTAKVFKGLEKGSVFTIKGTVKEHSSYRDENSTSISRPKVVTYKSRM